MAAMREVEAAHTTAVREAEAAKGGMNPQATTGPPGNHASSGRQGPQGGKAFSLILPVGL